MNLFASTSLVLFAAQSSLMQNGSDAIKRIWKDYLNRDFNIGHITISVVSLVIGIVVIVLTILFSRWLSSLLERRIAKHPSFDVGLRYTIARLAKYAVIAIGVLIALKQAFGVDLTSLAVIFAALSVGIGFGLQYIAADIASGFILLFERPIRIGDRVTIDKDEGDVRSINLRTTIVCTNAGISIIVPNSKLVSQRVVNWSYGDPRASISIAVGVAYGSDAQLVTETMLLAAEGVERVLQEPPPRVQFVEFGAGAMEFRLSVWTAVPRRHMQIRSDINYRIDQLFRERGIEIPPPAVPAAPITIRAPHEDELKEVEPPPIEN